MNCSSSETFTRLLKVCLAIILRSFSLSLPSVLTSFMSTLLRRFCIVFPNIELFISCKSLFQMLTWLFCAFLYRDGRIVPSMVFQHTPEDGGII